MKAVQELWGAENAEDMEEFLKGSYMVKFQFVAGSPGYTGDLFIIQSDALSSDTPAVRLVRNHAQRLEVLEITRLY